MRIARTRIEAEVRSAELQSSFAFSPFRPFAISSAKEAGSENALIPGGLSSVAGSPTSMAPHGIRFAASGRPAAAEYELVDRQSAAILPRATNRENAKERKRERKAGDGPLGLGGLRRCHPAPGLRRASAPGCRVWPLQGRRARRRGGERFWDGGTTRCRWLWPLAKRDSCGESTPGVRKPRLR